MYPLSTLAISAETGTAGLRLSVLTKSGFNELRVMQCCYTDIEKIESDKERSKANGTAYHVVLSSYRITGTDVQLMRRRSCIVWENTK